MTRDAAETGRTPAVFSTGTADPRGSASRSRLPGWLRTLLGDLAWVVVVGAVLTLLFVPFWGGGPRRWLFGFVLNTTITLGIGLTIANIYRYLFPFLCARWPRRVTTWLLHVAVLTTGVLVGGELAIRVLQLVLGIHPAELRFDVFRIGFVVALVLAAVDIGYERLRERARETELRAQEARQQALRARLEALQARTNPHFLFNSLNTVASLVDGDPDRAERALERLSSLYRYTLHGSSAQWVRLEEEIAAVHDYLAMESLRFGERLRTEVEIEDGAGTCLVPPLLLQPLVENAVLHGVSPRREGGRVRVRAGRETGALVLSVEDDGPGPGHSSHEGSGTSLETLRDRLRLLYGSDAVLTTEPAREGGFRVTLRLPLAQPEDPA